MDWLTDPTAWIGLLTLTVLEIVLGIDNIIFISILAGKLPQEQRARARRLGLLGAFFSRLLLLLSIAWVVRLTAPLFTVVGVDISGRGLILILGGLFLIGKATHEIHERFEGDAEGEAKARAARSLTAVIAQIMVIDIVFSLDSVITAVGMAKQFIIMAAAMVIAVAVMLVFAGRIGDFVNRHPSMKILALSFLLLIGVTLVADGLGTEINKGYIYFAMGFALAVEVVNLRARAKAKKRTKKETDGEHPFVD